MGIEEIFEDFVALLEQEVREGYGRFFDEGVIRYKFCKAIKGRGTKSDEIYINYTTRAEEREVLVDIFIGEGIYLEIKYCRKVTNKPNTLGKLVGDLLKLGAIEGGEKYFLLVSDKSMIDYKNFKFLEGEGGLVIKREELEQTKSIMDGIRLSFGGEIPSEIQGRLRRKEEVGDYGVYLYEVL